MSARPVAVDVARGGDIRRCQTVDRERSRAARGEVDRVRTAAAEDDHDPRATVGRIERASGVLGHRHVGEAIAVDVAETGNRRTGKRLRPGAVDLEAACAQLRELHDARFAAAEDEKGCACPGAPVRARTLRADHDVGVAVAVHVACGGDRRAGATIRERADQLQRRLGEEFGARRWRRRAGEHLSPEQLRAWDEVNTARPGIRSGVRVEQPRGRDPCVRSAGDDDVEPVCEPDDVHDPVGDVGGESVRRAGKFQLRAGALMRQLRANTSDWHAAQRPAVQQMPGARIDHAQRTGNEHDEQPPGEGSIERRADPEGAQHRKVRSPKLDQRPVPASGQDAPACRSKRHERARVRQMRTGEEPGRCDARVVHAVHVLIRHVHRRAITCVDAAEVPGRVGDRVTAAYEVTPAFAADGIARAAAAERSNRVNPVPILCGSAEQIAEDADAAAAEQVGDTLTCHREGTKAAERQRRICARITRRLAAEEMRVVSRLPDRARPPTRTERDTVAIGCQRPDRAAQPQLMWRRRPEGAVGARVDRALARRSGRYRHDDEKQHTDEYRACPQATCHLHHGSDAPGTNATRPGRSESATSYE